MSSDGELVRMAINLERQAFDELVRRHFPMVRRVVHGFASIDEDVNDLVQEAFITAYGRLRQLSDPDKFAGWLAAITRNECKQWLRRRMSQPTLLPLMEDDSASRTRLTTPAARDAMRRAAIRETISDALAALNDHQQRAVRMHYLEGYDYRETAQLLNVPISVVRGRLDRARQTLRKELKHMTTTKNAWELGNRDLDILRFATACVRNSFDDPLNGLYFTGDGSLVCTDSHRILHYASPSLNGMPKALVRADLARNLRYSHAEAPKGRLEFEDGEAILRLPGDKEIRVPLIDKPYPPWERIVPNDWQMSVQSKAHHWLQALQMLALHRVMQSDFSAPERVVMVLSPEDKRVTLRQGQNSPAARGVASEMSAWFPADFSGGGPDVIFALNASYLQDAVSVLGLGSDGMMELRANGPVQPVLTKAAGSENLWMLTMPMAMPEA